MQNPVVLRAPGVVEGVGASVALEPTQDCDVADHAESPAEFVAFTRTAYAAPGTPVAVHDVPLGAHPSVSGPGPADFVTSTA